MFSLSKKRIFLDYASATPVLPEVRREMDKVSKTFENPSSIHREGVEAKRALEAYRRQVAEMLGIKSSAIIFTSGGTESNNLAILGVFEQARELISSPHIVISSLEHSSVRQAAEEAKRRGAELSVIGPRENGLVHPEDVKSALKPNTILVSVALVSSDAGVVQSIAKLGRVVREARKQRGGEYPLLHTDASQAANLLDTNVERLHVDMLTLDAGKIYGPKGSGLLAVRWLRALRPIIHGGGQEGGLRSGTENLELVSGLTKALTIAHRDRTAEVERLRTIQKHFIALVEELAPSVRILTPSENSLPSIVSLELPEGVLGELVLLALDRRGVRASGGSACANLSEGENERLVRFSFGRDTSVRDVERTAKLFSEILRNDII